MRLSLVSLATDQAELETSLQKLNDLCHRPYMISFWNCMNETLEEIDKGKGWIGRPCCQLPQSEKCMKACLQAQSSLDLDDFCRKSDEIAFYTCIERQDGTDYFIL
ncbi:reversion-inducing cysteine-rich protein with Kazal motifs [Trichonephila inaurata madagascariensis]|uniref:Reversion-inducing cysteine-rich protein with Kazal motifs n=1 Tax=Trichonephila inaurata madagascariensis TaxID=2747483 RepID=A0A8X6XP18_9ARAC|nr:reversion-inducing cysteine-rich protein with Kazal motifs [Trichonephila inaurata madagascariensis]